MSDLYIFIIIAIVSIVTMLLRFFPFVVYSGKRKVPDFIIYLGEKLPYAVMGMLIVYCLRNVSFEKNSDFLPSLTGVVVVVILHILKRNTLLSILAGTAVYMLMIQL